MLWTDVVTPLELTTAARMSADEQERNRVSLSKFLPNQQVNDTAVRLTATATGLTEIAEFRAYDAETPIGAIPGGKRVTIDLPALGQKVRVSEYDQLRMRRNLDNTVVANTIGKVAIQVGRAVADRMELLRGQVLTAGKATINENEFIAEADYGRDAELNITVGTGWQDAAASKPIEDLQAAVDLYIAKNGEAPFTVLMSKKAIAALMRCEEIRKTATGNTPSMVTQDYVTNLLAAFGLPEVQLYDRVVRSGGQTKRVIDENVALLLPAEGSDLGATFWGTTLESSEANYAIADDDRPGIVAGAYKDDDPMGVWVKAAAIGMPVLANANLAAAMTVLS